MPSIPPMEFSLDQRTASLGIGELADFSIGPRDSSGGGAQGIWRAQLGTHWHQRLRAQATGDTPEAQFEVSITGRIFHHGWTLTLSGRIDQLIPDKGVTIIREIKTVTRTLPAEETELRSEYPGYFAQLGAYLALKNLAEPTAKLRGELVFVEVDSGLSQTVALAAWDETLFRVQLERVAEFLDLRLRARDRLRGLRFQPPFAALRPGQETIAAELAAAAQAHPILFFEAPTGFGKTGALLEFALSQLRDGRFERLLYLTSKATGQLQVAETLNRMTALPEGGAGVATWHVRNKREHCINTVYHCSREVCANLVDLETKWPRSGLTRFYLLENQARDLPTLRAAGRDAAICPYEITRAALAFNDVWIGDYNYVFSPSSRGLFYEQPGFEAARTLLVIDEAHNLPSRVADVYSRRFSWASAALAAEALHRTYAPPRLTTAWDHWTHFLNQLPAVDALDLAAEDDARHLLETIASLVSTTPLDMTVLGPDVAEQLWQIPSFIDELATVDVPRLWWCPQTGELAVTCLDAARAIGPMVRSFGGAVLASATITPTDTFAAACGLDTPPELTVEKPASAPERLGQLNKRDTRRLYAQLTSGAGLLRVEESKEEDTPVMVRAQAPWREHAYDVAIDVRVDTRYQQRARHHPDTARTIERFHAATTSSRDQPACNVIRYKPSESVSGSPPASGGQTGGGLAVFFPSYRYAEAIQNVLRETGSPLRVALQPRLPDLAKQTAWVEESLVLADALFLVLGSSFAEGIDLLGGRIGSAMVVGPALPEVNPVQKARLAAYAPLGRDEAVRRVYQAPGIQKVNQALGRLVRAPGQRARVLLHCRRFAETAYANLLAPEYRQGRPISTDAEFEAWLGADRPQTNSHSGS